MAKNTEIVAASKGTVSLIDGYTSIRGDDLETRKNVYRAISTAEQLSDHLGETINLVDVIVQPVTSENEETGEVDDYLRSTLIDDKGQAFAAGSTGVASSLKNLFDVFGEPNTWTEPLPVKIVEKKGRKGFKFMTIELA